MRCAGLVQRACWAGCVAALLALAPRSSAGSSVDFLLDTSARLEAAGELDQAVARLSEALLLDATREQTYLQLARIREKLRQLREAMQVYDVLLARKPASASGHLGRARLRLAQGEIADAEAELADLLESPLTPAASANEAAHMLSASLGARGARPAQLALWRRILHSAKSAADPELAREASTYCAALTLLVGEADPAAAPGATATPFRRGLARALGRH